MNTNLDHKILNERPISQQPAIDLLVSLGYSYLTPKEAEKQRERLSTVILKNDLLEFLKKQKFKYKNEEFYFSNNNITKAIQDIDVSLEQGLMSASKKIYDLLLYGKSYQETLFDGTTQSFDLKFIDWQNIDNNIFRVTDEFSVEKFDKTHRRPDIVITVNGIPLVVIECKKSAITVDEGIKQLVQNCKPNEIPQLFKFVQLEISTNTNDFLYGTCATAKEYFTQWKEKDDSWLNYLLNVHVKNRIPTTQDRNIISLLEKNRLFEIIKMFTLYDNNVKKIARYQQFFGIKKAMDRILGKDGNGSRNGVIWHTQGSGKSLTMVMLVKNIIAESEKENSLINNPRFVLVTDRINLDKQLRDNFTNTQMAPSRATTGAGLLNLLKNDKEKIITTVIHKFSKVANSNFKIENNNIFVFIDECHRSQSSNFHNFMLDVLPNAVKIGFTGTPIIKNKKLATYKRIGKLIDAYTIKQGQEDKVIVPLVYEGRIVPQKVTDDVIDKYFDKVTENLTKEQKEDFKHKWSRFIKLAHTTTRLRVVGFSVKEHFEKYVKPFGFKAMLAESSRAVAVDLYYILKNEMGLKVAVVISPEAKAEDEELNDEEQVKISEFFKKEVEPLFGNKYEKYDDWVKNEFLNLEGSVDIIIVKDKLLTGFDAPIAKVLYVDKPMKEHNLLQAIARVNRIYPDKDFGWIVDFYGIFTHLNEAMDMYSNESGLNKYDKEDIEKALLSCEDVSKDLFESHKLLLDMFDNKQLKDTEELQISFKDDERRKELYEKVIDFTKKLEMATNNYQIYSYIGKEQMQKFARDLAFFRKLVATLRLRYKEIVDFSKYEVSIKKLLDSYVIAQEDKTIIKPTIITDKENFEKELAKLPTKTAKADAIVSSIEATLVSKKETDPMFYKTFKQQIETTLYEYAQTRDDEVYYSMMEKISNDYGQGFIGKKYPNNIETNDDAKSIYSHLNSGLSKIKEIENNSDFDICIGNLSVLIAEVFKQNIKPGWQYNTILINELKQQMEDLIFDFCDSNEIKLSFDSLDKIEEQIVSTMKARLNK